MGGHGVCAANRESAPTPRPCDRPGGDPLEATDQADDPHARAGGVGWGGVGPAGRLVVVQEVPGLWPGRRRDAQLT